MLVPDLGKDKKTVVNAGGLERPYFTVLNSSILLILSNTNHHQLLEKKNTSS